MFGSKPPSFPRHDQKNLPTVRSRDLPSQFDRQHVPPRPTMTTSLSFRASPASSSLSRFRPPQKPNLKSSRLALPRKVPIAASGGDEPAAAAERRSLAVATGEAFIKLASLLLRNRKTAEAAVEDALEGSGTAVGVEEGAVVWEQRGVDVGREMERRVVTSPGFSFSAAGLLFPYHLGVAQFLLEKGYIKETTPLAGSSAGAIICAVIASGKSMQDTLEVTKILAEDCRSNGTAFRLGAVLRDILTNFLPEDVHVKSNGRIRVAVTELLWKPRGLLVDNFDSKEDLINAVITSSFIPGYLEPRPVTLYRKRVCIDGGLTLFMPPTSASETIRVCAFPANKIGLEGIGISPHCNPENRATIRQLFNWALEPAEEDVLDELFELGYLDASTWAETNPVELLVKDDD